LIIVIKCLCAVNHSSRRNRSSLSARLWIVFPVLQWRECIASTVRTVSRSKFFRIDYGNFEISVYSTTCIWILVENIYCTCFRNYRTCRKLRSSSVESGIISSVLERRKYPIFTHNTVAEIFNGRKWVNDCVKICHSVTSCIVDILYPRVDCLVVCQKVLRVWNRINSRIRVRKGKVERYGVRYSRLRP